MCLNPIKISTLFILLCVCILLKSALFLSFCVFGPCFRTLAVNFVREVSICLKYLNITSTHAHYLFSLATKWILEHCYTVTRTCDFQTTNGYSELSKNSSSTLHDFKSTDLAAPRPLTFQDSTKTSKSTSLAHCLSMKLFVKIRR